MRFAAAFIWLWDLRLLRGNPARSRFIDVGASAGLHLVWPNYGYDYEEGRLLGDLSAPVQLRCRRTLRTYLVLVSTFEVDIVV
jgi:hypothetical protein